VVRRSGGRDRAPGGRTLRPTPSPGVSRAHCLHFSGRMAERPMTSSENVRAARPHRRHSLYPGPPGPGLACGEIPSSS
jgi:hypothetical protein